MYRALSFIFFVIAASSLSAIYAQPSQPDDSDRQKWMTEMRNFKHDFLAKDLDLTKDQQQEFFAAYDQMEDRINRLNADTRELEQRVLADDDASDVELDAAARAVYQLKNEESKIELEYFDQFKKILQPKQLIRLKNAERKFTQQLMIHHRRLKNAESGRRK